MKSLDVVVTNDDGIDSPGLAALASAVAAVGHRVRIIAPTVQVSGAGGGIATLAVPGHDLVERRSLGYGTDDLAVAAEPAMIVLWSVLGCFGPPPDLIMSGINLGSNLGSSVAHSGTFGAALTAVMHGVAAVAVSLCFDDEDLGNVDRALHWDSAARSAVGVIGHARTAARHGFAANLNVPNAPIGELRPLSYSQWMPAGLVPSIVPFVHRLNTDTSYVRPSPPVPGSDRDFVGLGHPNLSLIGLSHGDVASVLVAPTQLSERN